MVTVEEIKQYFRATITVTSTCSQCVIGLRNLKKDIDGVAVPYNGIIVTHDRNNPSGNAIIRALVSVRPEKIKTKRLSEFKTIEEVDAWCDENFLK